MNAVWHSPYATNNSHNLTGYATKWQFGLFYIPLQNKCKINLTFLEFYDILKLYRVSGNSAKFTFLANFCKINLTFTDF